MTDPHSSQHSDERRNFFRVQDRVLLEYQKVDAADLDSQPPERFFAAEGSFQLMRELRSLDLETGKHLRGIGEKDRATELYLRGLNKKLELLANALAMLLDHKQDAQPQTVSISEGGVALLTPEVLTVGAFFALQITLLPDYLGVCVYAKVVDSRPANDKAETSLHFVNIKDSERQILARHILQVQIAARKGQRQ